MTAGNRGLASFDCSAGFQRSARRYRRARPAGWRCPAGREAGVLIGVVETGPFCASLGEGFVANVLQNGMGASWIGDV